jgi:Flp pilus assembly protein TadD
MKDQNDTSFSGQYNTALAAFNAQQYEKAVQLGKKLLRKATSADKIDVYRLIGNAAIKMEDWEGAQSWFSKLTRINHRDAVAWYNMSVAAYNLDRVDDSWDWYQKARSIDPKISNKNIENRYKALHTKPKDTTLLATLDKWYNQAVELQQKGKHKDAKKIYKKIIGKDADYYRAWNNLGTIYSGRSDFKKAIECHKTAISCKEDVIDGYANLVIIYIAMEDLEQAEEWLNKGKEQDPENEILQQVELELNKAKDNREEQ